MILIGVILILVAMYWCSCRGFNTSFRAWWRFKSKANP